MSELLGAVPIPVTVGLGLAQDGTGPLGDPLLRQLGGFSQTVLNTYCAAAWAAIEGSSSAPVETVAYNDPQDNTFNSEDLPALFVYRDHQLGHKFETVADDLQVKISVVRVLWVPTPEVQELRADRSPFVNAVLDTLSICLFRGQDSNWTQEDETDPNYLRDGTPLQDACGTLKLLKLLSAREVPVKITMDSLADPRAYPGVAVDIEVQEAVGWDATLGTNPAACDAKTRQSDAHVVERLLYPPVMDADGEVMLDGDGETMGSVTWAP